jgi:YHS domain-containing protein
MATVKDPICGKEVDTLRARAVGIYGGVTYYFCSPECKSKYVDPRKTPREPSVKTATPARIPAPSPPQSAPAVVPAPAEKPLTDPSLELPPMEEMAENAGGDEEPLPDLTPAKPRRVHSPSVIAEVRELKKSSRRWALLVVILAAVVVAAAVLSLRN